MDGKTGVLLLASTSGDIVGTATAGAIAFTANGAGKDVTVKSTDSQVVLDSKAGLTGTASAGAVSFTANGVNKHATLKSALTHR